MCNNFEKTGTCDHPQCKYEHKWDNYFNVKPKDIHFEVSAKLSAEPPFVAATDAAAEQAEDALGKTVDFTTECPVYKDLGYCTFGWRCRFLGGHIRRAEGDAPDSATRVGQWELLGLPAADGESKEGKNDEINWPKPDVVNALRKNKVGYGVRHWLTAPVRVEVLAKVPRHGRAQQGVQPAAAQQGRERQGAPEAGEAC